MNRKNLRNLLLIAIPLCLSEAKADFYGDCDRAALGKMVPFLNRIAAQENSPVKNPWSGCTKESYYTYGEPAVYGLVLKCGKKLQGGIEIIALHKVVVDLAPLTKNPAECRPERVSRIEPFRSR